MATGGTIPNNRSQSVTFYDTTGIIERHKNIYYAPIFEEAGDTDIRNAYLSRFNEVCPPSSAYTDIDISSWSPQDRTLVVRGNIDDFRLVTDEGACLNYFIITRRITKGESVETYYYGFFITGVSQSGGSSITITAEPDDFTNVFFLHNRDLLTVGYDPFNKKMSNCYVNRQHYDRVKVTSWAYRLSIVNMNLTPNFINIGDSISIYEDEGGSLLLSGIVKDYLIDDLQPRNMQITITVESQPSVIEDNITIGIHVADNAPFYGDVNSGSIERTIAPDNIKIFLNQEESFKYKYQYRDMKYPLSVYDSNFTKNEISIIESEDNFNNLSVNLQKKIIRSCIYFLVVETKSPEICLYYRLFNSQDEEIRRYNLSNGNEIDDNLYRPNVIISYPFILIPEQFRKYKTNGIGTYNIQLSIQADESEVFINVDYSNIRKIYQSLNKNAIADYINACYVSKDVMFPASRININTSSKRIIFNGGVPTPTLPSLETLLGNGEYIGGLRVYPPSDSEHVDDNSIKLSQNNLGIINSVSTGSTVGLILSGRKERELSLTLETKAISAYYLRNNYYDEVLESEPYSFYSLSTFSTFELPFNKNRYYNGFNSRVILNYYVSFNGANKVSYVPKYSVENKTTLYFNEALTFTLTNMFPLISDSYSTYYYQNMAQMKNQFAVNDYHRGIDLLQHFFVSGPNAVGYTASRKGGWGALAETGNQVMEMVDEGIDWAQSNKEIEMNQKAKLSDMGAKPDVLKQGGSELFYDLLTLENGVFLNHYTIDELSYNSIAKLLERTGYQVNLYDELHTYDRVGWNFIKLNGFDWNPDVNIMVSQEESIRTIFINGVTLLHNKNFLTSGHNYEKILEE